MKSHEQQRWVRESVRPKFGVAPSPGDLVNLGPRTPPLIVGPLRPLTGTPVRDGDLVTRDKEGGRVPGPGVRIPHPTGLPPWAVPKVW